MVSQAWKPGSQHAGEKRGVAGLLLGAPSRARTLEAGKRWARLAQARAHNSLADGNRALSQGLRLSILRRQ